MNEPLTVTLAELLVLVDALEASLHYRDLLDVFKFDERTRDRVLRELTERMHAREILVEIPPERKTLEGLYPVGDEG
jgi:hypothetical protein